MPSAISNKLRFLISSFDALTTSLNPFNPIPISLRWRLIPLQFLNLITYSLKALPYAFGSAYNVIWIPTRSGGRVRAIVFQPSTKPKSLHIDFHGGAFIGGVAEIDAWFCEEICRRTEAVVSSAEYRHAPAHIYPSAHEDAEDVVEWCMANSKRLWGVDEKILTVSGGSAGGNLMFSVGKRAKAAIGICPVLDLRRPPWEKRKPDGFPKRDILHWMMPLFDAYAGPVRNRTMVDAKLNPILKDIGGLPENVLFVVAGIDILYDEQMKFAGRVRREFEEEGRGRKMEVKVFPKGFHGWLELPKGVIDEEDRRQAWNAAIEFIVDAQRE